MASDITQNPARNGTPSGERAPGSSSPALSIPKGGGAIRGIGEKFSVAPATGTPGLSVPLPFSAARGGASPGIALSYDSGAGQGPFGLGWSLSLPSISRTTDKGIPRYRDAEDSDVFLLSGTEDLVPCLAADGSRESFVLEGHRVDRYRPRVEGLFARIERWTRMSDGDVHWRTVSASNVTTTYGRDATARLTDPDDARRVFRWLIEETRDDRGDVVLYQYKPEDRVAVDRSRSWERNRRCAQLYPKRILYGNARPFVADRWHFEAVFDYGEHDEQTPSPAETGPWPARVDAFSTFKAGFEVRTYRLCRRVLMFHHFDELGSQPCLVRSTDFGYDASPSLAKLTSVTPMAYVRQSIGGYRRSALPPLELSYAEGRLDETVRTLDTESLEDLGQGLSGEGVQWADLDGEGLSGILSEQGGAWHYKRNLGGGRFSRAEAVALRPSLAHGGQGSPLLADLAGDGQIDLVQFSGPTAGFFERRNETWAPFTPFASLPRLAWNDPDLRFVDLDGDGRADILITEHDVFRWHPSLGEAGFGAGEATPQVRDEETGPALVFNDGSQSVFLADMSGDGLQDLVRIRNGEISYWPNLGYGRFGPKVAMGGAPLLDAPEQFDPERIRLADIDGSGPADLLYFGRGGTCFYINQAGNSWSEPRRLETFPHANSATSVQVVDLLGNGTGCLVWSSPLPGDAMRPLRYIELTGGVKPHLLERVRNNLGAETRLAYASSTRFYLEDRLAGRQWSTRLPFPVHVVERVETFDHVSRNRFVSRYVYHDGYFDGEEREFRGFGFVEQRDTEEFSVLSEDEAFPIAANLDAASHVPPVLTRTWFHTGAWIDGEHISRIFEQEYYQEDSHPQAAPLTDTELPPGLSLDEIREACRALKGATLRTEIYAADGTAQSIHPYTVAEANFTVRRLQERGGNRHSVFLTHPRESLAIQYERHPDDPRVTHAFTLDVDDFGNVLSSASVAYGRRQPDPALAPADQAKQTDLQVTCMTNRVTNAVLENEAYRTPSACESHTFELLKLLPLAARVGFNEMRMRVAEAGDGAHDLPYEDLDGSGIVEDHPYRRLIEHTRTIFRRDDLSGRLPLGEQQSLGLTSESYRLALTPALVAQAYGGRVTDAMLADEGRYLHSEGDTGWWIASGQVFFSPDQADSPEQEQVFAGDHFFLPCRFRDPFGQTAHVRYDRHDLLLLETEDATGNRVTAGERNAEGDVDPRIDYRVLQPMLMTDANGNRSAVAFDTLGRVAGAAVMGKPSAPEGDSLAGFSADLEESVLQSHLENPLADPHALLQGASTRTVYDPFAYHRTRTSAAPQPAVAWIIARQTHVSDETPGTPTALQHGFSYSDGFGREIQRKVQAEPEPLLDGGSAGAPRWVGTGWTIFNNKGNPVRQYEPFFSTTHMFEFARTVGVSPIVLYDPLQRAVATIRPDHAWDKVVFDSWRQETWDANDTVLQDDPAADPDVGALFQRLPGADYLPTWHARRADGALGPAEQSAAEKAAAHADTPGVVHFDVLGRPFVAVADNGPGGTFMTRTAFDIEGNVRQVVDALGRIVMRYDYDLLGGRLHQSSMDAGERWTLNDIGGNPIRIWDSRGHAFRSTYDALRRPVGSFVVGSDPLDPDLEVLFDRTEYGEGHPDAAALNLHTRVFRRFDSAGIVTHAAFDFKGNLLRTQRQFAADYRTTPDWSGSPPLEPETFATETSYDALNRPTLVATPDGSEVRPIRDAAGLLKRVDVRFPGTADAARFVTAISYDATGKRTQIAYGNGLETRYTYDPLTLRLLRLRTAESEGSQPLQDIEYAYDPAGNITAASDSAQQALFFANSIVEPHAEYVYDALYRLVSATGREHLGQLGEPWPSWHDDFRRNLSHPQDGQAMRRYSEHYDYDAVGNLLSMNHLAVQGGWTRIYEYDTPSPIEADRRSNRLTRAQVGSFDESYSHDVHGNMTQMPHLPSLDWDFRDQFRHVDLGGGGKAWYVYDGSGQRVRKVWEKSPGRLEERFYLAGVEVFRQRDGSGSIVLQRDTLRILDGSRRIALVESRTQGDDGSPERLIRYQFDNCLGSVGLEVDEQGSLISYEEFYPFGATSYHAVRSTTLPPKRYRYTTRERDEETGLGHHGARYYAPWLGRWSTPDPRGLIDGPNLYAYSRNNPSTLVDPLGTEPPKKTLEEATQSVLKQAADRARTQGKPLPADAVPVTLALGRRSVEASFFGSRLLTGALDYFPLDFLKSAQESLPHSSKIIKIADMPQHAYVDRMLQGHPLGSAVMVQEAIEGGARVSLQGSKTGVITDVFLDLTGLTYPKTAAAPHTTGEMHNLLRGIGSESHAANVHFMVEGGKVVSFAPGSTVPMEGPVPKLFGPFWEINNLPGSTSSTGSPPASPAPTAGGQAAATAAKASSWDKSTAALAEHGPKALKRISQVFMIYGALNVGANVHRDVSPGMGTNKALSATLAAGLAIPAGAIDDAMVMTGFGAPFVIESWDQHGAGPAQRVMGAWIVNADRDVQAWQAWLWK